MGDVWHMSVRFKREKRVKRKSVRMVKKIRCRKVDDSLDALFKTKGYRMKWMSW